MIARALPGIVLALVVLALPLGHAGQAYTVLDFVMFDGVEYVRWMEEPGRALAATDLGPEFAVISCAIGEDPARCLYGEDAGAGLMPSGTRVYAVKGYATDFRLAAVSSGRIFLYQAWRSRRAKRGGDLYDIVGRTRTIDVRREEPKDAPGNPVAVIDAPADVAALVEMLVTAPVQRATARPVSAPRYWLTFWLTDGTTLGRAYFPDTGDLAGGVALPPEFRSTLQRYLDQ